MEGIPDLAAGNQKGRDLDDLAVDGAQAGGFGVKNHDLIGQKRVALAFYRVAAAPVVHTIGFYAVNDLDLLPCLF